MKRILVIDDDIDILEALQVMLTMEGFAVEASVKDDAIQKINGDPPPDMIILDVLLSGKDGRTICKKLKKQKKTKHIPVLMISAHPDAQASSLKAGADGFLAKPFEIEDLLNSIKKILP